MKDKYDELYEEMLKEAKLPKGHQDLLNMGFKLKKSIKFIIRDIKKFQIKAAQEIGAPPRHDAFENETEEILEKLIDFEKFISNIKHHVKKDAEDIENNLLEPFS